MLSSTRVRPRHRDGHRPRDSRSYPLSCFAACHLAPEDFTTRRNFQLIANSPSVAFPDISNCLCHRTYPRPLTHDGPELDESEPQIVKTLWMFSLHVSLDELGRSAAGAYSQGIDYLMGHTLPSPWTEQGCGWQEVWETADYAGFYASCDGILLLSRLPPSDSRSVAAVKLTDDVYRHHLCVALDTDIEARSERLRRLRAEASSVTMKLAKFLQASAVVTNRDLRRTLTAKVSRWLQLEGESGQGWWRPTISTPSAPLSVSATVESLLALRMHLGHEVATQQRALSLGLQTLRDVLAPTSNGQAASWKDRLLALWAVSKLACLPNARAQGSVPQTVNDYLDSGHMHDEPVLVEKFSNNDPLVISNDYYSFNTRVLLASSIINYIAMKVLPLDHIRHTLDIMREAIVDIQRQGFYKRDDRGDLQFWESYQAMDMLHRVQRLLRPGDQSVTQQGSQPAARTQELEVTYMYVRPALFQAKPFATEDDLAVVIMPLTRRWSADVFTAFASAVKSRGMRVWRSDLVFRDDQVMQTIWEHINKARVIIADCTGRNPNVFYELGIAHVLGKPVFICAQKRRDFPFDITGVRSYEYDTMTSGVRKLRKTIQLFIDQL